MTYEFVDLMPSAQEHRALSGSVGGDEILRRFVAAEHRGMTGMFRMVPDRAAVTG